MFQVFRRIGFFRRRWIWGLLLVATLGLVGYWMVPWRGSGADLQLVAMRPDGTFAETVRGVPAGGASDDSVAPGAQRGIPLVLGIANTGMRPGRPQRLVLNLPRWFRLHGPAGAIRTENQPDEPLQRFVIETDFPLIESGRVPTLLPQIDTLWLEPFVPDYWCTADADSVPQLIASTPPDTGGTLPVQIFWSFEGQEIADRQTGLLTIQLPGAIFARRGPTDMNASPVNMEANAPRPAMGTLVEGGTRSADCGPPGDPMRVFSALWITPAGGRMISIHYGGLPRKEYYDLNRDSIIELEMWDPDGDGNMNAWRTLRVPIPEYLLPEDPITVAAARADSARADSLARVAADTLTAPVSPVAPLPPGAPALTGARMDLATLGRLFIPGDVTRARRLFVPRAPAPRRVVEDDGPIGIPVGEDPEPAPEPETPPVDETPEPAPDAEALPEDDAAEEEDEEPDLIDRVLQEAAEQDADDED